MLIKIIPRTGSGPNGMRFIELSWETAYDMMVKIKGPEAGIGSDDEQEGN